MNEAAIQLGTHGPTVKREESEALEFLNQVLLQHDNALAKADLRPGFIKNWNEIGSAFEDANGDIDGLRARLSMKWQVSVPELDQAMPTFVAVLTGYPYGRLGRYTRFKVQESEEVEPLLLVNNDIEQAPTKIILRGFRRVH